MGALTALVPWPYRLIALAVMVAALVAFGWVKGASHMQAKSEVFETQVNAAGKARATKTAAIRKDQTNITANTEATYAQGNPALRDLYGPGRVRRPDASRRPLSAVPGAAPGAHAVSADREPGAAPPAAGEDLCAGLRSDAAVTTRQLLFLQDWVERQSEAMNGE